MGTPFLQQNLLASSAQPTPIPIVHQTEAKLNVQANPDPATKATTPDLAAILAQSRNKRKSRRFVWPLLVIMAVGALLGGYSYFGDTSPRFTYTTAPAKRGDLAVIVTATGSVQPTDQVDISSELSGTVRQVNVNYNSAVKKGAGIITLRHNRLGRKMGAQGAHFA